MLELPQVGMRRSVDVHNVDLDILCDWIEASAIFSEEPISRIDVIDELMENEVYETQEKASEIVEIAWSTIKRRTAVANGRIGLTVEGLTISRAHDWDEFPAYAFCLAVCCAHHYAGVRATINSVAQGQLFEELSEVALKALFNGWVVKRVGWSPDNPVRLHESVGGIIKDLKEREGAEMELHVNENAKELGLDLLAFSPFNDEHASFPIMMIQCASGRNWESKRHTPDLKTWKKVVSFNSEPIRGMTVPFSIVDSQNYRRLTAPISGAFFDRYRLLAMYPIDGTDAVVGALNVRLTEWVEERLQAFLDVA